jgi:hypothetical protein
MGRMKMNLSKLLFWRKPTTSVAQPDGAAVAVDKLSREVVSTMVMRTLNQRIEHTGSLDVWLSNNYDPAYWEPRLQKIEDEIAKVRTWAKTLPYGAVRSEYLQWLTYYYESGLNDARKELRTKETKREQDEFHAKNDRHFEAVNNAGPIPTPPR